MKKKITLVVTCLVLVAAMVIGGTLAYFTDTKEAQNTFTVGGVKIDLTEPEWNEKADHTLVPDKTYAKDPTITLKDGSQDSYLALELNFNKYNSLFWVMAADASADEKIDFTIFTDATHKTVKDDFKNDKGQFSSTKFLAAMAQNKTVFQQIVNKWFGGITHTDWEIISYDMGETNTNCFTMRLAYIGGQNNGVVKAGESVTFMTSFGMPASVTQEMIEDGVTVGKMSSTFNTEKVDFKLNFVAYAIQAQGFNSAKDAFNATFGK